MPCWYEVCQQPYKSLHPHGDVENLTDELNVSFAAFYENSHTSVQFSRREQGYIIDAEGP